VGPHEADRTPVFFISYAHDSGEDDGHIQRFYRDLNHDVLMFAGRRTGETAGFCDVSFQLGEKWSPALIENLSTAQVFIPILSPVYFASPGCGKEWTIYTSRLDRSGPRASLASSIIPLLWVPIELPPIARPYQYREAAFGTEYDEVKLRSLIRENRYLDHYQSFVQKLAQRVVDLSRGYPVAEAVERPGFDSVRSAFLMPPPAPRQVRRGPESTTQVRATRSSSPGVSRRPLDTRPILNTYLPSEES
jgi:TIR domain